MDFKDLVHIRQSVRKYSDKPIEAQNLEQIIESARLAPSASNSQPWHLVVIDQQPLKSQIAKATFSKLVNFNKFAPDAAVLIVIVIEKPKTITKIGQIIKKRDFTLYDIGIVAEHICLQAAELGIGSCILGWFNEKKIMKMLDIPSHKRIGLVITLGYTDVNYKLREKIRKSKEEIVSFNKY